MSDAHAPARAFRLPKGSLWAVAFVVWLSSASFGSVMLWRYKLTPSASAHGPAHWPAESTVRRGAGLPTLVMFAHPHCPCTRASLSELSRLMTRLQGTVAARVLFLVPDGESDDWEKTDLWDRARALDGVEVMKDADGSEAARFGAVTSGQTLLYDRGGELVFSGGITPSRGHEGDNAGFDRIVALVTGAKADRDESAVYGCSLHTPEGKEP